MTHISVIVKPETVKIGSSFAAGTVRLSFDADANDVAACLSAEDWLEGLSAGEIVKVAGASGLLDAIGVSEAVAHFGRKAVSEDLGLSREEGEGA